MHTENDIMNNLKEVGRDTTCVIVAHRLSTVQDCDVIVVMDNGRVVEIGSHEDLVRRGGRYSQLLSFQKSLSPVAHATVNEDNNTALGLVR